MTDLNAIVTAAVEEAEEVRKRHHRELSDLLRYKDCYLTHGPYKNRRAEITEVSWYDHAPSFTISVVRKDGEGFLTSYHYYARWGEFVMGRPS